MRKSRALVAVLIVFVLLALAFSMVLRRAEGGMVTVEIGGRLYALNARPMKGMVTFNIRLLIPEESYRPRFQVVVANLTSEGIEILRTVYVEADEKDGLVTVSIEMWMEFMGLSKRVEGDRLVEFPVYRRYGTFIYAIALDEETGTLFYGSWTAGVSPYYNRTVDVALRVRSYHSTTVTAKEVPDVGQSRTFERTGPLICAAKIPGYGVWREVYIPDQMRIDIDSYERLYWSDESDPTNPDAMWYDEGWEKSGTTPIYMDCETKIGPTPGPLSNKQFLMRVKYIEATTGSIGGAVSHVIVKVYAVDDNANGIGTDPWSPSGSRALYESFDRPDPGQLTEYLGYALRPGYVSYTTSPKFAAAADGYEIAVSFSRTVTYKVTSGYIRIGLDSWDDVPSDYNELRIYRVGSKKGVNEAEFTP